MAKIMFDKLKADKQKAAILDGDVFRKKTGNQDFTDEGCEANLIAAAIEAQRLEKSGHVVVMAFVAPKKKWREMMRAFWAQSRTIYLPGGTLWVNTTYEKPDAEELWQQG